MKVICDNYDCAFERLGECTQNQIWLENSECQDYIHYKDAQKNVYVNEYYRAVLTKDGVKAKELCKEERKVAYRGLVFYTEEKVNDDDYDLWVTEELSGLGANLEHIMQKFDLVIKAITIAPKIKDLPLAKRNEKYELVLVESEVKG